ncbi:MAG: hypothetical protein ACOC2K_01745, partial [Bacteroidota bacterium]
MGGLLGHARPNLILLRAPGRAKHHISQKNKQPNHAKLDIGIIPELLQDKRITVKDKTRSVSC